MKATVAAVAVVFIFCSSLISSCNSCEPEAEYTVAITGPRVVDMHGSLWSGYTPAEVSQCVMDSLRRQFSGNLQLVNGPADIHIYIDSIRTDSYEWDDSQEDPCYGDHSWLYQLACPPAVTTYHLRRTAVTIIYTLVDSVHLKTNWGRADATATEYLYQPPGDSITCYQYEVAGDYDHLHAMLGAAKLAFRNFKCEIKKMMEP